MEWLPGQPLVAAILGSLLGDGNRLAHLDELDPWRPDERTPRLTTPAWIGEEDAKAGVEAAIVLSIDDMMDPAPYEAFLRPILERLKQVEGGRAPLTIFTCRVDPAHPKLAEFLAEGVSFEVHTFDHPCPLFRRGDLSLAAGSVVKSTSILASVPNHAPVAFRMPCCDSLNTSTPRFYDAILPVTRFVEAQQTWEGPRLHFDSSIAIVFTSDDPELPRDLVQHPDGTERFLAYLPADRRFANYVTNHPYPYPAGERCFELPFVLPSDWQGQHRHGVCSEKTLEDLKAAIDLTVAKQGLFTLVFHPYAWIRADQVVALIDHAVEKHRRKVKFLSVRDVAERLTRNVCDLSAGEERPGAAALPPRLADLDEDGRLDVIARAWSPARAERFGVVHPDGRPSVIAAVERGAGGRALEGWTYDGTEWGREAGLVVEIEPGGGRRALAPGDPPLAGGRMRDLDGDGRCEWVVADGSENGVFRYDAAAGGWRRLGYGLPSACRVASALGRDEGVRFLDVDEDGDLDLVVSGVHESGDEPVSRGGSGGPERRAAVRESGLWLFESLERGWTTPVGVVRAPMEQLDRLAPQQQARLLPLIARADGSNNGMWVKDRALWWVNEDTDRLPVHCDRRGFDELLAGAWPLGTQPPPRSPAASLRSLHARPGFAVELVAAEPLVADPICIEWGADGRLWVVEMGDYPLGAPSSSGAGRGGRVKVLEDTDLDGAFDRASLFLDELPYPTSVLPWRDGVLVTAAPDLLFAADRDGDGRAEVREVLFTGFGEGNPQHRVNGLRCGLDGWVWGANGDSDGEILSTRTGARVDISGRDWRCDPDRGLLEPVTGRTQYGRERDDFGHWFGGNNSVPMWHFVLEDRYLRRNPFVEHPEPRVQVPELPDAQPVFPASVTRARFNDLHTANRFTSACSPMVYRDDLFGPAFSSSAFVCEPVHNLVHREVIERAGVTFRSRRAADEARSEFLASSDPWFRPVQARTGPDGALWIVDMYREVIEHPEWIPQEIQTRLDLRAGADRGRIYRVLPVDRRPRPIARLDHATVAELTGALRSPNGWVRDTAQRLLLERGGREAIPMLRELLVSERALARLHALCTLAQIEGGNGLSEADLLRLFHDPDPGVRSWAIRVAEPRLAAARELRVELPMAALRDADEAVRLQATLSLRDSDPACAGAVLVDVLMEAIAREDLGGRMLRAAAMSSLSKETLEAAASQLGAHVRQSDRADAHKAILVADLAPLAVELDSPQAAAILLSACREPDSPAAAWQVRAVARLLAALERAGRTPEDFLGSLSGGRERVQELRRFVERGRAAARDASADPALREAAVALLGREDLEALAGLTAPGETQGLARAAVGRLAQLDDERVPRVLLDRWRSASPELRAAVLDVLLRRDAWLPALLDAIAGQVVSPRDLELVTRQRLLRHEDEGVRARAEQALAERIAPDRAAVVEAFRPALALAGDRARGQQVFERRCATCHALRGIGHAVGPDLATMADPSPESWLVAIFDPNRAVESRYVSYSAVTRSDEVFTGVLVEETSASVTLRDSGGKEQRVPRAELASLKSSAKSLMVEGLESETTPQDVADLFAFLRSDQRPGKRLPGNEPLLVRPMGECGALHLTAATAEIYGPRLVFETRYGNLGWWQSGEDFAAWTIEVARAGTYEVVLDFACDASSAGATLVLEAGASRLTFEVPSTGTWDDYREQPIGTLELAAGLERLTARPAAPPREAVIDLREIRLTPR